MRNAIENSIIALAALSCLTFGCAPDPIACPIGQHLEYDELSGGDICQTDVVANCAVEPGESVSKSVRFICEDGTPIPLDTAVAYAPVGDALEVVPPGLGGAYTFDLLTCQAYLFSIGTFEGLATTEQVMSLIEVPGGCAP